MDFVLGDRWLFEILVPADAQSDQKAADELLLVVFRNCNAKCEAWKLKLRGKGKRGEWKVMDEVTSYV